MRHQWQYSDNTETYPWGRKRVCAHCGKRQNRDLVYYDRMIGAKYSWRPLAGRCIPQNKQAPL